MSYESVDMEDFDSLETAIADTFAMGEVLASAYFLDVYYFACRARDGSVRGWAVMERLEADGIRLYKPIPEESGPAACCCPLDVLALLSETDDEWALTWRMRCRAFNTTGAATN